MSSPTLNARVYVSWDGTGTFTGPYDDVTADTAGDPGFQTDEGRDSAQTLSPPKVQAGSFALFNDDGKYSQHRADSSVYQRVLPGRPVGYRISYGTADAYDTSGPYDALDPYDGIGTWDAGVQLIDEISQTTEWGNRRVGIQTIGREVVLTDSVVTVALQTNIRTDQAVVLLLDACGWPAAARSIAISDTTLLYWWCDERHPWDALLDLLGAEGPGTFYVDRSGTFHWENRNYRTITPRSAVSVATYYDRRDASGLWFTGLAYDPGYKQIYNRATARTKRRATGAAGSVVWQYGTTLSLTAGQTRTLIARPSELFTAAISPALTTDYVLTAGTATVTLTYSSGFVAFIDVTAGGSGCTIDGPAASPTQGIQLRATPLTVISETTVENSVDASASIATFSPIPGANIPVPLVVSGWPEIDPANAEAVCNAWVNRYKEARPLITITLRNADNAHVWQILERMPSDRVTLVEANTGLAADAWINSLQLRIGGAGGRVVELVLGCELCDELSGAVWDLSLWNNASAVWGI